MFFLLALMVGAVSLPLLAQAGTPQSAATVFPGTTTVGQASTPVVVTITVTTAGTAVALGTSTQGAVNSEFAVEPGGTCAAGTYTAGTQCTVTVSFQPLYPGPRVGAVQLTDSGGNVLGQALVAGIGKGSLAVLAPGQITTAIGSGYWIYAGDNSQPQYANLFLPMSAVEDAAGNLYVSDSSNNRIRMVTASTNQTSTVAGNGTPGYTGDGGPATAAEIDSPAALVLDGADNIYFADSGNSCVRRVDHATHVITTVAGVCGVQGYSGDGGLATAAKLSLPEGLAMDMAGNLFISDTGNNAIRRVDAGTGLITTFAGKGPNGGGFGGDGGPAASAMLNGPWGIAVGSDDSVYIADMKNQRVRKVDGATGIMSTIAGYSLQEAFEGDGGPATAAVLSSPAGVAVDPAGNVYIADADNNRVREIFASNGVIQTIAGGNESTTIGDGGTALQANLYGPYAVTMDKNGNLLIADMFHNRIREVFATPVPLSYDTIKVGKTSAPKVETLENDGNDAMNVSSIALSNAALDAATTTCAVGTVPYQGSCALGVEFAPTVTGNPVTGSVTVNSDAGNSPSVVNLSGQVLSVNPTSVVVASSLNPSMVGGSVTFTATISSSDTGLGGTVNFLDGATKICSAVNVSAMTATCTTSALTLGSHSITANYAGDANNAAATSPVLTQVVKQQPTVTLTAGPNPAVVTGTVTLTATVTPPAGSATGTVTFSSDGVAIGSANLNSGVATFQTSQLTASTHALTASYSGDANDVTADSNTVQEVVNLATTVTTLATNNSSVPVGTSVTFTAGVTSTNGPAPTGTVKFLDGTTVLGTGNINSGVATFTTSTLTPGAHAITAAYNGDTDNATSTSSGLTQTSNQIGTVTLVSSSANPLSAGATVTFTATVSMTAGATADGAISGTVTFTDGTATLGTSTVDANGKATLQVASLAVGSHSIVAAYNGNTNYATSTSSALAQTVQSTVTSTSLTANGTGLMGKPLTFTATVTSSTGTPTGNVTFKDGATVVGQGSLNAQGVATITTTTLPVGNHNIVAVYGGDANYTTSTSAAVPEAIALATPTVTLVGPGSTVNAGTQATFTASLASPGVAPTGTVTLRDGATSIGAQTVSGGTFTFNTSSLVVGTHTLTVVYGGDVNNATATSNAVTVVVQQGSTSTALATSKTPQVLGQAVVLSAAVTSPSPNITGNVNFYDGTTLLGSAAVNAAGAATLTTSSLTFGVHSLTAVYVGDTNHAGSTSAALSERIVESVQIGLTSSANPAVSGASLTFSVKVAGSAQTAPTGTVQFLDGTTLLGTATLDATGAATLSSSTLAVGTHAITVAYLGDDNYSASTSSVLTQSVINANTQVTLTASANPATFGQPLQFKAVVVSNGGVATGSVTFTDGTKAIGTGVLDANGTATLTLSTLAPGTHAIVANYAGDGKASASVSAPLALVVKQTTAVAVASSANPSATLSSVTFTATVTNAGQDVPGGVVTFTDGGSQIGTGTLDGNGVASITVPQMTAATHSIVATYAGNGTNFGAASAALTETVQLRPTSTALTATTDPNNDQQVTLIGVVRWSGPQVPTGTVTFTNGSAVVGTVAIDNTGVATLVIDVGLNKQTLVATYNGDTAYAQSASPATTIGSEPAPQFTMTVNPSALTLQTKQHTTVTLTLNSPKNFADNVEFGCLGLPYAATCTFSKTQSALAAGGTTTVQLTIDTGNPLGAGASTTASNTHDASSGVLLCFLPGGLLAGLVFFGGGRRKKQLGALLAMVFAVGLMFTTTGCGGLQMNSTPVGKYTFQVTARGQNTGVAESQTVTLNVTQ